MSISTKTGDDGTSSLLFNRRVPKTDLHIEAVGTVDELNAALGLARASAPALDPEILKIQNELVLLMGELALLPEDRPRYDQFKGQYITAAATDRLTTLVHEGEKHVSLTDWVMPGGSPISAPLDFARAVCRRAERRVLTLHQALPVNPEIIRYLNRLSDLLFVWARKAELPGP
jgi:cob(I)alamin adenosyltransferase